MGLLYNNYPEIVFPFIYLQTTERTSNLSA
jgi:hypothetical protein